MPEWSDPGGIGHTSWFFPVAAANEWSRGSWMPNTKTHRGRTHAAIDIYAERGAPIVAPVGGTVINTYNNRPISGNGIRIRGDDGITYYFAHMNAPTHLQKGGRVEAGALVGFVGNTGSAKRTKPHLHFSMKLTSTGGVVNPAEYLQSGSQLPYLPTEYPGYDPNRPEGVQPQEVVYVGGQPTVFGFMSPELPTEGETEEGQVLTSRQMLGGILSSVSNAIAGGERQDYRTLGRAGVPEGQLEVNVAGDVSVAEEEEL